MIVVVWDAATHAIQIFFNDAEDSERNEKKNMITRQNLLWMEPPLRRNLNSEEKEEEEEEPPP